MTRHRPPEDCFFRAGDRRFGERFAGAFLRDAVEPERLRVDAGRRDDVVRAGMRRTVIRPEALNGQARRRVT
jgi:hypothetical protein